MRRDELQRVSDGSNTDAPRRSKSMKMKKLNEKVRRSLKTFKRAKNVRRFLKEVTYQEKFDSYYKDRINYSDDSDGEDDEIIPNNWNKNWNLVCLN